MSNAVTYGFECEFRAHDRAYKHVIFSKDGQLYPRHDWIDKKISKEKTGNTEIRSVPSTNLELQLERMQKLKDWLGTDIRGFHIHFRFPLSIFKGNEIDKNTLGWLGRFGDALIMWRVQNFEKKWTFGQWSQVRPKMEWLKGNEGKYRGVIRDFKIKDKLDVEIRGLMIHINMFRKCVNLVVKRFQNKESMKGYFDFQNKSMDTGSGQEKLSHFLSRYLKKDLSDGEIKKLKYLELYATVDEWKHPKRGRKTKHGRGNIVLYNFEHAPYFSDETKSEIKKQNLIFCKNLLEIINSNIDNHEMIMRYQTEMKKWATKLNLFQKLFKSL